ncbi:phage tail baseplate protein [Sphingomonas quercus]|uniref:Phage tail protein n=1 Tax=Sphingomonas quercus TaxID=2842451 RepID=A0ABS6BKY3_9SPHN|nr:phage tail protein [Sphingomonas quercus]MBU3078461.1 phage tail protein [Sphingomonas quercus]
MATLVLTTVGTMIGGPIGGAVGAVFGSLIDTKLLAPKGRQGARLSQLAVQTSSYGSAIPRLFGTLRVAGTVIWATDLREAQHRSGGGKGAPKTTSYSYSASFAVALSGRPIRGVKRIWADGKLLRGEAGDWKSQTGYRLHTGGEDQPVDPLIASAEGVSHTPAYRGMAYAVFEDFQLADYGNHIPSLTFEVEADAGPVSLGMIAHTLSDGDAGGAVQATLGGFAAAGDSIRGVLQDLAEAVPLVIADDGERLILSDGEAEALAIGGLVGGEERPRIERRAAGTLPDEIALGYFEPARDYQAGLQRARRAGPGRRAEGIDIAAALDASAAKALAEARLARDWAERTTAEVSLSWRALALRPGEAVTLPGRGERWRIVETTLEAMRLRLSLVASMPASGLLPPASAGRPVADADLVHGATQLVPFELPSVEDALPAGPRLWIAAAGTSPGWRRAELMVSLDGGTSWQAIGATAAPAVTGSATSVLTAGQAALRDDASRLDVTLLHDGMELVGRQDIARAAEANLALVGDELIQFAQAVRIRPGQWRLRGLLRGRRGTEWAMAGHQPGERFVLIDRPALTSWDPPASALGAMLRVQAAGVGDAVPAIAELGLRGAAIEPPAPVHLRARRRADGGVGIVWTRRSRAGWTWIDGDDVALGETAERYRLTVSAPGGRGRSVELAAPAFDYDAAAQTADGIASGAVLSFVIRQQGSLGVLSAPATTIVN